jgi:nitrite reductase/ring-hydroxylating ferredoxin subunit
VAPAAEPAPAGPALASVADVESAGSIVVGSEDAPILLVATDGTVIAHTAKCTHQGCKVGADGLCPCHQSRFNINTGAVENGPATRPLAAIAVTVSGGQVYQS